MANTVVQSASAGVNAATNPVAFGSNNTAGNLLVALTNSVTALPTSITDSAGNTWILLGSSSTVRMLSTYYCLSCRAGANTVTANYGGTVQSTLCIVEASAGAGLIWVVDGTYTAVNIGGPGTAVTGNSLTFAHNSGIVISQVGVLALAVTITAAGSWVKQQQAAEPTSDTVEMQTQIVSAAGSYTSTATISASNSWDVDISGFAAVPAPAGGPSGSLIAAYDFWGGGFS